MSAEAVATLRRTWEKLSFARITRVIAREPEDVLSITVHGPNGHREREIESKRTVDIPAKDRSRTRVAWRHYYGFTTGDIYFHSNNYCELDCDIDMTMNFSRWGNHTSGQFEKPETGSLICGEVGQTPKGKRFNRWFVCNSAFELLYNIVMKGTSLSDKELGRKLLSGDFPDRYWAIARLVLLDNVQAFVDQLKPYEMLPPHPGHGLPYGKSFYSGEPLVVNHLGMEHGGNTAKFVHEISLMLNEPKWWTEFKRLAEEQGLARSPFCNNSCGACRAEKIAQGEWCDEYAFP